MTMGSFSHIMGQETLVFSETYSNKEIVKLLDKGEIFFTLLNREEVNPESSMLGTCPESEAEELWKYLHSNEFQTRIPMDLSFAWGWKSEGGNRSLFALRERQQPAPGQKDLESVGMQESNRKGNYDLMLTFSKDGADSWARMTKENVDRNVAIVLDGKVVAAPMVRMEITMGKCMITGDFSKSEASEMKSLLEN